ncbi:hypothetical protein F7725_010684, partial [Dissostichus mawsoni]
SPIEVKRDPKERQRGSNRKWFPPEDYTVRVLTTWTWDLDLDPDPDPDPDPDLDLCPLRVTAQWSLNLLMGGSSSRDQTLPASDWSKDDIINFTGRPPSADQRGDQESSEVPGGQSAQQHQTQLDSIFTLLEDHIVTFVKSELKNIQKALSSDYPECLESQREDEEVLDGEDEEQRRSRREAFLNITLHFLRSMKQEELADRLQSSKR